MKILRVGDPHIRPQNVEEANALMEFVKTIAVNAKVDRLEILGDLFHTHAVIRLEVLLFWNRWLEVLSDIVETVVLVGNHDMPGHYANDGHSLTVFKRIQNGRLKIIDKPTAIGQFVYCPYIHDEQEFLAAVHAIDGSETKVLVCHAEFSGSQYDNGFYSPKGFNPDNVRYKSIITGHIHKEQIIANGKVDMPGTPKWDTASDANERKGIWLYEHDVDGRVLQRDLISTEKVCTPIVSVTWNEGEDAPAIPENAKVHIELIGSSAWVTKQKTSLKGKMSIKTKITDKKRNTASRKAGNSLAGFILNTYSTDMSRQSLVDYGKEIGCQTM